MRTIASVAAGRSDRVRRRVAWAAPAIVVAVVAAVAGLTSATASDAAPSLAPRSAHALLTAVQQHTGTPLSGTVRENVQLGLPTLPGQQSSASLNWQSFLTGSHTARVWIDGTAKQRVALLGQLSEADVVHNGRTVWSYTSDTNTVTRATLPAAAARDAMGAATQADPGALATKLLAAIRPSTAVTVSTAQRVAGRPAYTLVLQPRDSRSTVHQVRIAIDAAKYVPLRVQVFGASATPAVELGFTAVSFTRPAAHTFAFKTPAGARVSDNPLGDRRPGRWQHHYGVRDAMPGAGRSAGPTVIGGGWTAVVELRAGMAGGLDPDLLQHLTTASGTSGARVLHTALVNAVFLPDGRVFAGAVSVSLLTHVATTTAH